MIIALQQFVFDFKGKTISYVMPEILWQGLPKEFVLSKNIFKKTDVTNYGIYENSHIAFFLSNFFFSSSKNQILTKFSPKIT